MLAIADSAQQGLFDASWCGNVVPRDSGRGRPSIPPSTLAKILLLAYRCGLSDRQAMEGATTAGSSISSR